MLRLKPFEGRQLTNTSSFIVPGRSSHLSSKLMQSNKSRQAEYLAFRGKGFSLALTRPPGIDNHHPSAYLLPELGTIDTESLSIFPNSSNASSRERPPRPALRFVPMLCRSAWCNRDAHQNNLAQFCSGMSRASSNRNGGIMPALTYSSRATRGNP